MKKTVSFLILVFLFSTGTLLAQSGEELFKTKCSACHTIGKGKLVGPDLAGIHQKQKEDWLVKFIKSSQTVISSGDEYAKKRFEEFNKVIMPDAGLSDAEIKSVLNYISSQSSSTISTQITAPQLKPLRSATTQNIENGKMLFSGDVRLINGGASCVSCHNVPGVTSFGGGSLAIDLTNSYTRLSESGLTNIIMTQPFPVMNKAFINHPLTDQEAFDLAAYLKNVDEISKNAVYSDLQMNLLYTGIGGFILLLACSAGYWHNRKKKTVNYDIYKRQEDFIKNNS